MIETLNELRRKKDGRIKSCVLDEIRTAGGTQSGGKSIDGRLSWYEDHYTFPNGDMVIITNTTARYARYVPIDGLSHGDHYAAAKEEARRRVVANSSRYFSPIYQNPCADKWSSAYCRSEAFNLAYREVLLDMGLPVNFFG